MVGCMATLPAAGVMAAPEDLIDDGAQASLTIHKYDITAAEEDGIDLATQGFKNNGKEDTKAETVMADYAIAGVEFSYVKVGNIVTKSEGGDIKVLYEIPASLATALNLAAKPDDGLKFTSDELNHALADLLADNTNGKNILERTIKSLNPLNTMQKTDADGVSYVDNLPVGLYFIAETAVPANVQCTVDPFFISLPMTDNEGDAWFYDVEVYPKNQTSIPNIDKLVRQHDDAATAAFTDTATASTGDVVDYIHVSKLPKITSEATYLTQYDFLDKMDKGLSYNKDTQIYFYDNEADARANNTANAVANWQPGSANFTTVYGDFQMEVKMTAAGLKEINPKLAEHWIVVSYSATVNKDASAILGDTGNKNDVTLTWRRTNMENFDTLEDRARVYSYALNIQKNFAENADKPGQPKAVRFALKNETNGHYVTAVLGTDGVYYIADGTKLNAEPDMTAINKQGTLTDDKYAALGVFVPGADGKLQINGLEADEYTLTELETSDGYSLLRDPIAIKINCTQDTITPSKTTLYDVKDKEANEAAGTNHFIDSQVTGNTVSASATVDGKDTDMSAHDTSLNARVDMSILNSRTFRLPQTGGMGTIAFTLGGCAMAIGGVVLVSKKKKATE